MLYDRYKKFRKEDGTLYKVPFIPITKRSSDKYITYRRGKTRMDNVSYEAYGDANFGWLILQANPEYSGFEFEIPEGSVIRVPLPLQVVLNGYENDIENYKTVYGLY